MRRRQVSAPERFRPAVPLVVLRPLPGYTRRFGYLFSFGAEPEMKISIPTAAPRCGFFGCVRLAASPRQGPTDESTGFCRILRLSQGPEPLWVAQPPCQHGFGYFFHFPPGSRMKNSLRTLGRAGVLRCGGRMWGTSYQQQPPPRALPCRASARGPQTTLQPSNA